jgi:hypothetical protein
MQGQVSKTVAKFSRSPLVMTEGAASRAVPHGGSSHVAMKCNRRGLFPRAPAGDALRFDVNSLNRTPTFASPLQGLDAGEASAMPCASVARPLRQGANVGLATTVQNLAGIIPVTRGQFSPNRPGRHDQRGTLQPWRWRNAWLLPLNLPSLFRRLLFGTPQDGQPFPAGSLRASHVARLPKASTPATGTTNPISSTAPTRTGRFS